MDVYILDKNREVLTIIDTYISFIWTERYRESGDFELEVNADIRLVPYFQKGNYVWHKGAETYMLIEDFEVVSDIEDGNKMVVTGRSLESILDRRVIWGQTILSGNIQDCILKLLNENIINPSDPDRKIPNFQFYRTSDPRYSDIEIEVQYDGENLYDAIVEICEAVDSGFRVIPSGDDGFIFELYAGEDRSYSQDVNSYVVFSPDYDNLASSNYQTSSKDFKTAILVGSNGEGDEKIYVETTIYEDAPTGLERRETYLSSSASSKDDEGNDIDPSTYIAQLVKEGQDALYGMMVVDAFDADIDATQQFIYGQDFFLGDIVQVRNEYGIEANARISEMVYSVDTSGETYLPTFTVIY